MQYRFPSARKYLGIRYRKTYDTNFIACAILTVQDHTILLFSDRGYAAICYESTNERVKRLHGRYTQIQQLRDGQFPYAFRISGGSIYTLRSEGRLRHGDDWKRHFNEYLRRMVF